MNREQFEAVLSFLAESRARWPSEYGPFHTVYDHLAHTNRDNPAEREEVLRTAIEASKAVTLNLAVFAERDLLDDEGLCDMWTYAAISFGLQLARVMGDHSLDIEIAG